MMRDDLLSHLAPLPPSSVTAAERAPASATTAPGKTGTDATAVDKGFEPFGADGFTFSDLLDIVNPLQHIPIVAAVYRRLTGDAIDPGSRVAGGALYGGLIGAAVGGANALLEEATGEDAGELVISMLTGDHTAPAEAPAVVADSVPNVVPDAPPPVPDLALLGALPPAPTKTEPDLIDLAQLAPLPEAAPDDDADDPAARLAVAPEAIPDGAVAADGGWFTQTVLDALDKYRAAAQLAADSRAPGAASARN